MIELTTEFEGVASSRPGKVVEHGGAALGRGRGSEWTKTDICHAGDIDQDTAGWEELTTG